MKKLINIFFMSLLTLIMCAISMSFAKYQKSLQSDSITINSLEYVSLIGNVENNETEQNKYNVTVVNNNDYEVEYKIQEENDLYNVTCNDIENSYLAIPANSTSTVEIILSGREDVVYEDMKVDNDGSYFKNINLIINENKPYGGNKLEIAEGIKVVLQKSAKNQIIKAAGEITTYEEGHIFSGVSSIDEKGLCSIIDPVSGETIYFYRGNVTNNYMTFAGKIWRILRINSDGSLRLILDSIASTCQYQSPNVPTTSSISGAIELLAWENSIAYTQLQTWYNNNIATNYSDYIVKSNFVFDTSYELRTSSATKTSCYYFGPYLRAGVDGAAYQPTFSYTSESLVQGNIGLITADEMLYAGGFWKQNNTSYFLYNSAITTDCWTMSPAFWDNSQHHKAGMMVHGASGSIHDWPDGGGTIATSFIGLRPVISVRGDLELTGDGSKLTPYQYKN